MEDPADLATRDPFPPRTARERWEEQRRRLAEWQRLDPQVKRTILETLYGAPQRLPRTEPELRVDRPRLRSR
jgi:hypothetical protein